METQKKLQKRIEEYELMLAQNFDDEIYAALLKDKNEIELVGTTIKISYTKLQDNGITQNFGGSVDSSCTTEYL